MVSNRTAQIASIIEKRQPLATKIEEVENNLQSLSLALHGLDQHRSQLLSQADDVETRGRLQEINLTRPLSSFRSWGRSSDI